MTRRTPVRTPADVGAVVREQRRQRGWSQQELAVRSDVSRQWIVAVEKGKARAELRLVLRVLEVLALDLVVGPRPPARHPALVEARDIDALLERARGRRK